jgi:siroheme synthase-like protein
MLRLDGQPVLVVGAGRVAAGKVDRLARTGAHLTVVAPDAVADIAQRSDLRWHRRTYQRGEAASYRLVVTCTGNPAVDGQVYDDCQAAGVFVNSADDPEHCTVILPAVARRDDLTVAISTEGRSPAMATWLRRRYQRDLDDHMSDLLQLVSETRERVRRLHGTSEGFDWQRLLDDGLLDDVREGRHAHARFRLLRGLGLDTDEVLR